MNRKRIGRALISAAVLCGVGTQVAVALGSGLCVAVWPATITQCQDPDDVNRATGRGSNINIGGNNVRVTAFLEQGTTATGCAQNANGDCVCFAKDQTPNNGSGASTDCFMNPPPVEYELSVN